MKPRMNARTGLILSACFALQLTPISLSAIASVGADSEFLSVLPQNRLSYLNPDKDVPGPLTETFASRGDETAFSRASARAYAGFIAQRTRELLPDAYKSKAGRITQVLIAESNRYKIDPLFLMAMIEHESQFRPDARGSHGEIGLMQVKPSTARWLAVHHGTKLRNLSSVKQLKKMLMNPVFNIRCGVAYLASLKKSFPDRPELYLAAYNRGPGSVRALLHSPAAADQQFIHKTDYSVAVMDNYRSFALDFVNKSVRSQIPKSSVAAINHVALLDSNL